MGGGTSLLHHSVPVPEPEGNAPTSRAGQRASNTSNIRTNTSHGSVRKPAHIASINYAGNDNADSSLENLNIEKSVSRDSNEEVWRQLNVQSPNNGRSSKVEQYHEYDSSVTLGRVSREREWQLTDPTTTSRLIDSKPAKLSSVLPDVYLTHDPTRGPQANKSFSKLPKTKSSQAIDSKSSQYNLNPNNKGLKDKVHVSQQIVLAPSVLSPPLSAIDSAPDLIDNVLLPDEVKEMYSKKQGLGNRSMTSVQLPSVSSGNLSFYQFKPTSSAADSSNKSDMMLSSNHSSTASNHQINIPSTMIKAVPASIMQTPNESMKREENISTFTMHSSKVNILFPIEVGSKSNLAEGSQEHGNDDENTSVSDNDQDSGSDNGSVYDWIGNGTNYEEVQSRFSTRVSETTPTGKLAGKKGSFFNVLEAAAAVAGNSIKRKDSKRFSVDLSSHLPSTRKNSSKKASPVPQQSAANSGIFSNEPFLRRQSTKHEMGNSEYIEAPTSRPHSMSLNIPSKLENNVAMIALESNSSIVINNKIYDNQHISTEISHLQVGVGGTENSVGPYSASLVTPVQHVKKMQSIVSNTTFTTTDLAATAALPTIANGLVSYSVKETSDVKRNVVHLPAQLNHPNPTSGDWMNKRYFVNDYILLDTLGKGSYGEVRLCRHRQYDRLHAMKIISKDMMRKKKNGNTTETFFEDIKREIAIMKKLLHPNVLRLFEVLDDPKVNKLYLVLEYMSKGDLITYLKNREDQIGNNLSRTGEMSTTRKSKVKVMLNDMELWNVFRQVNAGIKYLHYQNVVHGDIKPQNLLVSNEGIVKIADFGISRMLVNTGQKIKDSGGTPAFMSPELCSGEQFSGQSADVWAIGATIFMLKFGRPPFVAKTILNLYHKIQNDPLVFPFEANISLQDLFRGMLEKDPTKRLTLTQVINHPWLLTPPVTESEPLSKYSEGNISTNASVVLQGQNINLHGNSVEANASHQSIDRNQGNKYSSDVVYGFQPPANYEHDERNAMQQSMNIVNEDDIYTSIGIGRQLQQLKGNEGKDDICATPNQDKRANRNDDMGEIVEVEEDIMHTNWGNDVFEIVDDTTGLESDDNDSDDSVDDNGEDSRTDRSSISPIIVDSKKILPMKKASQPLLSRQGSRSEDDKAEFGAQENHSAQSSEQNIDNRGTVMTGHHGSTDSRDNIRKNSLPRIQQNVRDSMEKEEEERRVKRFQHLHSKKTSTTAMPAGASDHSNHANLPHTEVATQSGHRKPSIDIVTSMSKHSLQKLKNASNCNSSADSSNNSSAYSISDMYMSPKQALVSSHSTTRLVPRKTSAQKVTSSTNAKGSSSSSFNEMKESSLSPSGSSNREGNIYSFAAADTHHENSTPSKDIHTNHVEIRDSSGGIYVTKGGARISSKPSSKSGSKTTSRRNSRESNHISVSTLSGLAKGAIEQRVNVHGGNNSDDGSDDQDLIDETNALSMEAFNSLMDTLSTQPKLATAETIDSSIDITSQIFKSNHDAVIYPLANRNKYNNIACAYHSEQGHRLDQEDRCILFPIIEPSLLSNSLETQIDENSHIMERYQRISIGCIFDGHSGMTCSQYLSEEFVKAVIKHKSFLSSEKSSMETVIIDTCKELDSKLCKILDETEDDAGSTGAVIVYNGATNILTVGNVGDSICVLSKGGQAVVLNKMHRVDDRKERDRINKAGGTILNNRVNGILAITRAFGDCAFKSLSDPSSGTIISTPDVVNEEITPLSEFAIVATDGLWDVMSPQAAVNFIRSKLYQKIDLQQATKDLVVEALESGSIDNVTVLVMAFNIFN